MQATSKLAALALAIFSGAQMCLAAPQLQTLEERQDGVALVVQKFPDANCGQSLEENKFSLEPVRKQCVQNITNANSIQMVEQPSETKICTVTTWSGTNCQGSNSLPRAGPGCHDNLPFASFLVICSNIL
ncbi:hypothetical protein V8F33_008755 [Rhypophila sp. PSN 637]